MTTYWQQQGKHQDNLDAAFNELVPDSGMCDSAYGEAVRAISALIYEWGNNGLGGNDLSGAVRYLGIYFRRHAKDTMSDKIFGFEEVFEDGKEDYTNEEEDEQGRLLDEAANTLIETMLADPEIKKEKNFADMNQLSIDYDL